jgi:CRISPR-associated endonuclease/helicase Cas3
MSMDLDEAFRSLTGFSPMKWQRRLFARFVANDLPTACDIPTGLGKTSVVPLWLLALVQQAEAGGIHLPRRLVYIVNRRTVVDQATETVEQMRRRLLQPEHTDWQEQATVLQRIAGTLRGLCTTDSVPLAVSTLRGEFADNEEWKADPARPAIVVGTIDMIGSKLLFSGYGDGRYYRSHHAGLIGQDALIVHDEAHLTPAFSGLLLSIAEEQEREAKRNAGPNTIARPVRVIDLSATSRGGEGSGLKLEAEDEEDPIVRDRLGAHKRLHLHRADPDEVRDQVLRLAKEHGEARAKVLIYVRSPEDARWIASALAQWLGSGSDDRIALLTGTIRGRERDQLVQTNPVYRALRVPEYQIEETVYLVSTSAGEVGIDLDADHMVCDVTTLDALIQRLGRVNRRGGEGRCARVDVVGNAPSKDTPSENEKAIEATFHLLREWTETSQDGLEVGPGKLRDLLGAKGPDAVDAAFSPRPDAPPLTDILLDAWSLTSIQTMPGRPELAPFLHGLTRDPPETFLAWRHEIGVLAGARVDEATLRDWFRACRVESRERLRDRTDRVKAALENLFKRHRKHNSDADFAVVLLDEHGRARWSKLSEMVGKDFNLAYRTVVLPLEVVGLDTNGMLDPEPLNTADGLPLDVAEEGPPEERRERWLHLKSADGERFERLITGEAFEAPPSALREKERIALQQSAEGEDDAESRDLVLMVSPRRSAPENPETASAHQTLEEHTEAIAAQMAAIAKVLRLSEAMQAALVTAARWHDRGKDRPAWQRYARNPNGSEPLAKARRYLHPRALGGYRHEFGSLLEAMADGELDACSERDLVLHLIAAHHGWARPHFEPRSYDTTRTSSENDCAACDVMRRFGRLQQRFGRWGLAWLESLLRCADIAVSRQATEAPTTPAPQELGI